MNNAKGRESINHIVEKLIKVADDLDLHMKTHFELRLRVVRQLIRLYLLLRRLI